jgi:hypothetical protein
LGWLATTRLAARQVRKRHQIMVIRAIGPGASRLRGLCLPVPDSAVSHDVTVGAPPLDLAAFELLLVGSRGRRRGGHVTTDMDIFGSEIFGPAVVIHSVESRDAAIDLANDTEYGLTGGVISRDLSAALDVVSRVRSGIIHINDQGIGDEPMAPFGGVKNSGYGKFGGSAGFESFTEQRWITIQHTDRPHYPF